jgi:hypothetical protein
MMTATRALTQFETVLSDGPLLARYTPTEIRAMAIHPGMVGRQAGGLRTMRIALEPTPRKPNRLTFPGWLPHARRESAK